MYLNIYGMAFGVANPHCIPATWNFAKVCVEIHKCIQHNGLGHNLVDIWSLVWVEMQHTEYQLTKLITVVV